MSNNNEVVDRGPRTGTLTHHFGIEKLGHQPRIGLLGRIPDSKYQVKIDIKSWFPTEIIHENTDVIVVRNDESEPKAYPKKIVYTVYDKNFGLHNYSASYIYPQHGQLPILDSVVISDYFTEASTDDPELLSLVQRDTKIYKTQQGK